MELNFIVENLGGKKNYLFCFKTGDVRWFVYPQIMDKSDNMGGGDSACGNGNYKRQTMLSLVHNWTHKQHHEDHKHESFCLTLSLLLDFTYNPKHELELDLWESKKFRK